LTFLNSNMQQVDQKYNDLVSEVKELRIQLEEANDTIEAIRTGKVDALIVSTEDGSQLYTLKTADQTYRMFIEKMNEGAVTLNREGVILYCNSRFAEMVDMPLEKVIGLAFDTFVPDESKDNFEHIHQIIKNGWQEECKEEIMLLSSKQIYTPCLLSCNTLELDEGTALSLILTDLTIQKEAEKQLKVNNDKLIIAQNATEKLNDELEDTIKSRTADLLVSREHFRLLANSIPQMTWTNLPDGKINFYNQQWYNYTGLSYQESMDIGWRDIVHPDDAAQTSERFNTALKEGSVFEVENRYKRVDGVYRWHLNRAVPLRDESGQIIFWVGTATDIEDQKKEMERKDEFIGVASHELKTPLTSLKGYLQLINYKKHDLPPMVQQHIEKASIALNKLQNLVNDLLDVSKIQAGRLEYKQSPTDLTELVRNCIENSRHIYPDFTFEDELGEKSIKIKGNAERLEQVVMNLLNNAVKYSPESNKVIIKATIANNKVRVEIIDQGIGLSDKQQKRIFERFYRVEDKKYMSSGLGMGLYISKEIINNHHGEIGVQSQLGKGSSFYFELPLLA